MEQGKRNKIGSDSTEFLSQIGIQQARCPRKSLITLDFSTEVILPAKSIDLFSVPSMCASSSALFYLYDTNHVIVAYFPYETSIPSNAQSYCSGSKSPD